MYVGIAILLDERAAKISQGLAYELDGKYGTGLDFVYLLQHVSLKQSFPYDGRLEELEQYFREFFAGVEPFAIFLERLEARYTEGKVLIWMKARESRELRELHRRLCGGLHERFGILPLGHDGEGWQFHSTVAYSAVDEGAMQEIAAGYDGRELDIGFTAREAVMFCSMNMNPESFLCFEPRKFMLGG